MALVSEDKYYVIDSGYLSIWRYLAYYRGYIICETMGVGVGLESQRDI